VFNKNAKALNQAIEIQQLAVLKEAADKGTDSPEYKTKLEYLKMLNDIKSNKIDWTPIVVAFISAGASVFGIFSILNFERTGAFVSKASSMLKRP
jgi:hypothetical protein